MKNEGMKKAGPHAEYELTENRLLGISNAMGQRIECMSGLALITAYGEPTDFSLRAGNTFIIPNQGLTLIEAIGGGRIRVKPATLPGQDWMLRVQRKLTNMLHRYRNSTQGKLAP